MAVLFNITHDANNLNEYDATVTDGGDLSTGTPGLASTTAKMEAFIDDTNALYGQKNFSPPASDQIRCRFYIDTTALTMADNDDFVIFWITLSEDPWDAFTIYLGYSSATGYSLIFSPFTDSGNEWEGPYNISDAEHYIEFHVVRETADEQADGTFEAWIDGVSQCSLGALDNWNNFAVMNTVRLGATMALDAGTSGTFYLDELKANDDGSEIGPVSVLAIPRHPATIFQCPAIV